MKKLLFALNFLFLFFVSITPISAYTNCGWQESCSDGQALLGRSGGLLYCCDVGQGNKYANGQGCVDDESCNSGNCKFGNCAPGENNPPTPTSNAVGWLDSVTPNAFYGWAGNKNSPNDKLWVYFYDGANLIGSTRADVSGEPAICSAVGGTDCNHRFNFATPTVTTGQHTIHAFTSQTGTGSTPLGDLVELSGSPKTLQQVASPIPNCTNLTGPATLTVGQKGTYAANFSSPQGNLGGEIFAGQNGTGTWFPGNKGISGNSGSLSFDWTPTAAGTYDVLCRSWNDGIAECRGKANYVDAPPRYACAGPNSSMTVTVTSGSSGGPTCGSVTIIEAD